MNSTLNKIVIFALGAAVGSLATWKFLKTKYERIAQEEIDSVKEVFARREMERDEESDYPHLVLTAQLSILSYPIKYLNWVIPMMKGRHLWHPI